MEDASDHRLTVWSGPEKLLLQKPAQNEANVLGLEMIRSVGTLYRYREASHDTGRATSIALLSAPAHEIEPNELQGAIIALCESS